MRGSMKNMITRLLLLVFTYIAYIGVSAAQTTPPPSNQQSSPEELRLLDEWRVSMAQVPLPGKGCFQSEYPSKQWRETPCIAPSNRPMVPKHGPLPLDVGNRNDISAMAPTGFISTAIGSFDSVTNVTSESSAIGNMGPPIPNAYTLQINTDFFSSSVCAGTGDPADCRGWEQFVYENDGTGGSAYIQYWIIQYNNPCPPGKGWTQFMFNGHSDIYCYQDSAIAAPLPNQPITNLAQLSLSGTVTKTGDSVTFSVGGKIVAMQDGVNAVDAADGWTTAEFNVLGDGGNQYGGSQAVFNNGAEIITRNRIFYGGAAPPNCVAIGFTGETNNLSFPASPPAPTKPGPAVIFTENSAGPPASSNCAAATTVGDTHLYTFQGLFYDFQASGDFVVAQVNPNFVVEARQVSGAPTWPNAAVNHAIATQMGRDTVAVCQADIGANLFVNDRLIELGDGQVYSTPNGVDIWRVGNAYNATDQSGNSVNAVVNANASNFWINATLGLGHWPANLTGLVANANGNVNQIASSGGFVLTTPFPFGEFYDVYGESWRVGFEGGDLLSVCGEQTEIGDPRIPFYAIQLPPQLYKHARAVCTAAGVTGVALLDACTLDVTVIGSDAAAQVYVNARQPVAVGYIYIDPNQ